MDYEKALQIVKSKQSLGIMPGLSRIQNVMQQFGNVQNQLKVIHIAGTNGKGTVSSVIAKSLEENGFKVGLFTSPWVTEYTEQIQINSKFISHEDFAKYVFEMKDFDLTEFELVTAIMYRYFYESGVDFAVVECGMGGKGDSTSVVKNTLFSVITSVSLDHTNFLGSTVKMIAEEKSGIITKNSTVVLYPNIAEKQVFEEQANKLGCKIVESKEKNDFYLNDLETAKTVLNLLSVKMTSSDLKLPARCQMFGENIMLDGAHNFDGAKALETKLPKDREITAVVALMKDKDVDGYLSVIAPHCKKIIASSVPSNPRSMSENDLADIAKKYCKSVVCESEPSKALRLAKQKSDFILICGSFYFAREIIKEL